MQDVTESGTGRVAKIEGVSVASKTGTAENYGIIYGKREKLKDHSWFVCFAPRENPKIAVAVIVENAGFGATWAGPMAGLIMEKFLKDTLSASRWKEVERIESQEIILPIVKSKRNRLDSLKRERMRKQQIRVIANKPHESDKKRKETATIRLPFYALKPSDEEQFV